MKDGHIHSPYCPHGSKDEFIEYINKAISMGLDEMSFTEHFPLPKLPIDKEFLADCAIKIEDLQKYINDVLSLKEQYKDKIKINLGFEIDYIEGYESIIKEQLNEYIDLIEDSILSVHFVKYKDSYYAIDCLEDFEFLLKELGSLTKVYDLYYETVLKSIYFDLGNFKVNRIGHPTLVRKFCIKYPYEYTNIDLLEKIMIALDKNNISYDYNTSGLRKKLCGEIYSTGIFEKIASKYKISKVYGSDSHEAKDVGSGFFRSW